MLGKDPFGITHAAAIERLKKMRRTARASASNYMTLAGKKEQREQEALALGYALYILEEVIK